MTGTSDGGTGHAVQRSEEEGDASRASLAESLGPRLVAVFTLHERHRRRARDAYSPESVDRAAILVQPSQGPDAA